MQEKTRILTVIIVVVVYNIIDQLLIQKHRGINDTSVFISFVIAIVLYLALIYFFGKKHLN
jgi:cytosine/uracil/thiamine/allantoin permease